MSSHVKAAGAYLRISQDRENTRRAIERQKGLVLKHADRIGWTIAEFYVDNDITASKGLARKHFERMMRAVESGERDGVLIVDVDRFTRTPSEGERFIAMVDRLRLPLANLAGSFDLSTSEGQYNFRIEIAAAARESKKLSERLKREREQRATEGMPHPGPRAFGYQVGNMELHEREADLIRQAADDYLDGRVSLAGIAKRWNDLGVTTTRGNRWTTNAVRDVLCRLRNVARRRHHGRDAGPANWQRILDDETHERICARARAQKRDRAGRPPKAMLSPVLRCSLCDGRMTTMSSKGVRVYVCRAVVGQRDGNCGRLQVKAEPLEQLVEDAIIEALDGSDLLERITRRQVDEDHHALVTALRADEESLAELETERFVDRSMSAEGYRRARTKLQQRIARLRGRLEAAEALGVLATLPRGEGADVRGWWRDVLDGDGRRQVVERLIERIDVLPLDKHAPRKFVAELRVPPQKWVWRV